MTYKYWEIHAKYWCCNQRKMFVVLRLTENREQLLPGSCLAIRGSKTQFICSEQQDWDPVLPPSIRPPAENTRPLQRVLSSGVKKPVLLPAQMLPLGEKIMLFPTDSRLLKLLIVLQSASIKNTTTFFKEDIIRVEMKVLYLAYLRGRILDHSIPCYHCY